MLPYVAKFLSYLHNKSDFFLKRSFISANETLLRREKVLSRVNQLFFKEEPLKIVSSKGQYLINENGQRFLDCLNNVSHVGHCHPKVVEAAMKQISTLNTNSRFLNDKIVEYCEKLLKTFPSQLNTCFLVCSGTEANDLAIRLARAYTKMNDIITVDRAYHGHSIAVHEISPYKFSRPNGGGKKEWVHVIPCPDSFNGLHKGSSEDPKIGELYANEMMNIIENAKSNDRRIAGFIIESMQSCGGQIIYPKGFLEKAFKLVKSIGALNISDEVQVGFGRCGKHFWSFEMDGVLPDIVTIGKPIANGHPMAAVITTKEIADAFANTGIPYFNTCGGNPVSCAIAEAVLDVIEEEQLQQRALLLGDYWLENLNSIKLSQKNDRKIIGDVRGRGLFIGIEISPSVNKEIPSFKHETPTSIARKIMYKMKNKGYLLSLDGPKETVIKIKPPMVIEKSDIDGFLFAFEQSLKEL